MSFTRSSLTLLFLIFFFLFFTSLYGQNTNKKEIDILVEKSRSFERQPDSLKPIGTKILAMAKPTADAYGLIEGYLMLGYANYLGGDLKKSITYYDSVLIFEKKWSSKKYEQFFKAKRNRAIALMRSGQKEEGLTQFNNLLTFTKKNKDPRGTAMTYNNLGVTKKNEGNLEEAITLYTQAKRIYDSLGIERSLAPLFQNIGIAQATLGNNDQSLASFHEAIKVAKKYDISRDEYKGYNNLAVTFMKINAYDSAIYYIHKTIPHYKSNNIKRGEYLAYQNLGAALTETKKKDSALYYFELALRGHKEVDYKKGVGEAYFRLADLFQKQERYELSKRYIDSSITVSKNLDDFLMLRDGYTMLAAIYEKTQEFEKANNYAKVANEIKDKMFTLENSKQLNEILTKYQVEKKDAQIEDLNSEKSIYMSTSFLVGFISLVLLFIVIIFWLRNTSSKKELATLRVELENYNETSHVENTPSLLHLKSKAVVNTKELLYIKSDGHYLEFYIESNIKPEIDRNTLKEIKVRLEPEGFTQIHKSYVVNLSKIRIINSTKLMLDDGSWLPLSRTYKPKLKENLLHTVSP